MAGPVAHLSVSELAERFTACRDARTARQTQAIWLLAKGHSFAEAAAATAFSERWVRRLCERYNAEGVEALGDRRRHNGAAASLLTPDVLERLRQRLAEPPPDGGVWTSRTVADVLAQDLGREQVAVQRGWEALKALGWSLQRPRPRNPRAATPEAAQAFKKSWRRPSTRRRPVSRACRSSSTRWTSTASA
ncbi:helix-turn-helix domain-containing protein [Methylobacterium sp. SyP6R]|uniref:helix-turn-helix domain-containing protein n=1 Tax=Methylobacterium sp. SyP6R TaxID=2718876 RepID=UPI001F38DAC0|nr:helix-turn-helix domain-containing protein [Methylobacterium sp. SyP6R]MCF4127554.1 helix-turn-helix domain-containing protein [Methylobacterium sp. SyP6R]MCF4129929.1 helix-turn-helix domain-containing protein [Methylobacterium sp. SyP6R]MCF4130013.1 helix-turn-helix domain-containing protein [Methylobacterium sp. SyP6R]MCF4130168.1 helix-turn-helix domain-containing protein [Methylobacterium sp. SyP6R]